MIAKGKFRFKRTDSTEGVEVMYVRIEEQMGFRIRGFRTDVVTKETITNTRQKLKQVLEIQRRVPRRTYGVFFPKQHEELSVAAYFAGIVGASTIPLDGAEDVIVSSGRYVIASSTNETYDAFDFFHRIRSVDYFRFRKAPILEQYTCNKETGEESVELWVPIV